MVKKILVFQVGVTSKSVHACVFFFFLIFLFPSLAMTYTVLQYMAGAWCFILATCVVTSIWCCWIHLHRLQAVPTQLDSLVSLALNLLVPSGKSMRAVAHDFRKDVDTVTKKQLGAGKKLIDRAWSGLTWRSPKKRENRLFFLDRVPLLPEYIIEKKKIGACELEN